jgi:hypothetical protein
MRVSSQIAGPTPILILDHEDGSDLLPMLHGLDRVEASARLRRLKGIPPRFLYKFGRPDGKATKGILEASEFFLSPPSDFNDPFDSRARVVWEGTKDDLFNQTYFTALRHGKSYEQARHSDCNGCRATARPASRVRRVCEPVRHHLLCTQFPATRAAGACCPQPTDVGSLRRRASRVLFSVSRAPIGSRLWRCRADHLRRHVPHDQLGRPRQGE